MIEQLKALSDENRMRILNLLLVDELCVCEIETLLNMSQSNASRHLTKLRQAHIIISDKDAQWVHYKVNSAFYEKNDDLFSYLKKHLKEELVYVEDMKRYQKYKANNLSCKDIKGDIETVLTIIK